jgi:seryl-tRNA synthetase
MIDLKALRENTKAFEKAFAKKQATVDIKGVLKLDEDYRSLLNKVEVMRAEKNAVSKSIPTLPAAEKKAKIEEMKSLDSELKSTEEKLSTTAAQLKEMTDRIPNPPHESVPEGGADDNKPFKTVGKKPTFKFKPRDHMELGTMLDLIDTETGGKTSGARFYYLKNEAVLLEFALVNWILSKFVRKGFTPVLTPMLVKENMMYATGFFPADKNEIYTVNPGEDELYLIGTSEVTLSGLHMFDPIPEEKLPRRYIGYSSCFRREAGSYGKDMKGILRVHQFEKMEMFSYCHPDKSWEEHDLLLSIEEEILSELGLHYQVINICGGDLGSPAAKKYDCEVWIPSQEQYRELTSSSNCTDFQARRGNIRVKSEKGNYLAHTLNGTAMASTRTIIAILENYQQEDGSVLIPEILVPYMHGITVIKPK